jgi:hypothetical protein
MIDSTEFSKSYLHRLIQLFQYSFYELKINATIADVETMAVTVYNVMEARWRKYHSIDHVLSICETSDPIQILAGLFHDTVYLQIDRRIHPRIVHYLQEFQPVGEGYTVKVPPINSNTADQTLYLVSEVFGAKSGSTLTPFTGANEYLSAS